MPTGKLSGEGKKLFEKVYTDELKGKCKGDKQCAAQRAWGAVKNAGWKKDAKGTWSKKADLVEFSMYFEKAPFNTDTQEMAFVAAASDTEDDLYSDNMTQELFADFLGRIEDKKPVPEEFRSEFWNGGEPYVSISHYPDVNGKAAPGMVDKSWVDGNRFKSRGHFFPNTLGKAAYNAIWTDLKSPLRSGAVDKVRISIAFLDYKHMHKRSGYIFERKSLDDLCPMCIMELVSGEREGKAYLKGHLIHEALTRVPVNQRTAIEPELVERSIMTTQKEDAQSIVGEELAEFLNEVDKEKLKSLALVTHSEADPGDDDEAENDELDTIIEETEPQEDVDDLVAVELAKTSKKKDAEAETDEEDDMEDEEDKPMDEKKKKAAKKPMKSEYAELYAAITALSRSLIPVEPHPLDAAVLSLKSVYDETIKMDIDSDEKLRLIQEAYNTVGEQIIALVKPVEPEAPVSEGVEVARMISDALKPIEQKIEFIAAQLSVYRPGLPQAQTPPAPIIPERRSINPATIISKMNAAASTNQGYSPRALARKSSGLPVE
jgi:hypothetical protein